MLKRNVAGYSVLVAEPLRLLPNPTLVVMLPGTGQIGDGSFDGTLVTSATNKLAMMLDTGPLRLIANAVPYFSDNNVVVAAIQKPSNGTDFKILDKTIQDLITYYKPAKKLGTGLSLGAGDLMNYARQFPLVFDRLAPIETVTWPSSPLVALSDIPIWMFSNADDGVAAPCLTFGNDLPTIPPQPFIGWASAIANKFALDNHPDKPVVSYHAVAPHLGPVRAQYTAMFGADGVTWVNGCVPPTGCKLAVTLTPNGGHSGWDKIYGTNNADFNKQFWDWLIQPSAVIVPAKITSEQLLAIDLAFNSLTAQVYALNSSYNDMAKAYGAIKGEVL